MRPFFTFAAVFSVGVLFLTAAPKASAVELLTSGDFETPMGIGDIPFWNLEESFTDQNFNPITTTRSSAQITNPMSGDKRIFLTPFTNGGSNRIAQGNFDLDGLPQGNVDGHDFITWQRGFGIMGTATGAQGDATGDMNVDGADFSRWDDNYGRKSSFSNAVLTQVVPITAGNTYEFRGTSTFEDIYSGLVDTLDAESPYGAITSPTTTFFKMEFLDAGGSIVGTVMRDLKADQLSLGFPGTPLDHPALSGVAPAGAVRVRLVAEAKNMAYNGNTVNMGAAQSAFFNNFSLVDAADPGTELAKNAGLDDPTPDALDFWNVVTDPDPCCNGELLRTPIAGFANNTPGGTRGVWLSAFFGGDNSGGAGRQADPVTGQISQTVPAMAGATYTFAGATKFEGNYSGGRDVILPSANPDIVFAGMPSPTKTEIELAFLDAGGNVIGTPAVIDVKAARSAQLGCTGTENCANSNTWLMHTLQAVAPAGTVNARITGQMIDGVNAGSGQQSAFFDDFSLDGPAGLLALNDIKSVPEPSAIALLVVGGLLFGSRRGRETRGPRA